VDWFERPPNKQVLQKLKAAGVWPRSESTDGSPKGDLTLDGLTFVVTGALEGFTRQEIKEFIQSYGGKVTGSVSSRTNYLVIGENPGSKIARAEALGIPVLNERDLRVLAEGS